MADHDALDLGGIGVEATDDVHVLLPIGDPQVAVVAQDADVPRAEPPLLVDRLLRRRRILEVLLHDVEALHQDLTGFVRRDGLASVVHDAHLTPGSGRPTVVAITSGASSWRHMLTVPVVSVRP